jgi:16S rRNA (cytidine1402-2'-O)-methyltransferase
MPGTLYVVATPIGNLEDISARALRVLRQVALIACEDTRRTRRLLAHYQICSPVTSYHQFSERRKLDRFLALLNSGKDLALVSDAGTPTLSDPGALLVQSCRQHGISIVAVPGASSLLTALASSSFAGEPFLFWGFLPAKPVQRRKLLESLACQTVALVFFESPNRVTESLKDMLEILGDRQAYIGRELTKLFEESREGKLTEVLEWLQGREMLCEFTLIIAGSKEEKEKWDLASAAAWAQELIDKEGLKQKEASRRAAARSGFPSRAIYQQLIKDKPQD